MDWLGSFLPEIDNTYVGLDSEHNGYWQPPAELPEGTPATVLEDYTDHSGPFRMLWRSSRYPSPKLKGVRRLHGAEPLYGMNARPLLAGRTSRAPWSTDRPEIEPPWQQLMRPAPPNTFGVHLVDLPTVALQPGEAIVFTFFWPAASRWENVDFAVTIADEAQETAEPPIR